MPSLSKAEPAALRSFIAISSLAVSLAVAGCSSTVGFDAPFDDYLQRTALVSTTGGDSQAANTAVQTATPWPRYANDTNIPANGARMTAVIKRYESGSSGESASGGTQTSTGLGGANPGGATNGGASAGMTASPPGQPSGY